MPKNHLSSIFLLLLLAALIVLGLSRLVPLVFSAQAVVTRVTQQQEKSRPANLDIVVVADDTCPNCTKTQAFVEALQKQPVRFATIKQLGGTTEEGKKYIVEKKITKFPAVVVSGETSRDSKVEDFLKGSSRAVDDYYVYEVVAPYRDVAADKLIGEFSATYITRPACANCYNVQNNAIALKNLGVNVVDQKTVASESAEGAELIKKYKIRYLPTILLRGELNAYQNFVQVWPQVGTKEVDGTYVLREGVKLMGTYYDNQLKKVLVPKSNN